MTKIIDLSKTVEYKEEDPAFMRIKIQNMHHEESIEFIQDVLDLPKELMPTKFKGWANDEIQNMGVHSSTHIDAPWHYGPMVQGEKAKTIDEIPLDWLYGDGVVIDMSHKKDFDAITVEDLKADLAKSGTELKKGNIVLIRTDRDQLKGEDFFLRGTGMSKEATIWLIEQGVKVMGIDQWGWDLPLKYLIEEAKKTNNRELFWEGHLVGIDHEYLHIEQLTNLKALPPTGFKVAVFPLKIKGGSAAPARVVAIFED